LARQWTEKALARRAKAFFVPKAFFVRSRQWLAREHIARDTKKPRGQNPRGLVICSAAAC
jgi:hypothetical protein